MAPRVSVVGLGKLGASMLAAFASRGLEVVGVDVVPAAVDAVNAGLAPVQETGLGELIAANRERIRATLSFDFAVANSDISFVIVPTPSDERGAFSLKYAESAFRGLGKALAAKQDYHTVVLTSTVLPGATRGRLAPILERESGRQCGSDFGLCYSPEFIALGSVIRDFLHPDFTLIGELDQRSGDSLVDVYRQVMGEATPTARMSIENAELTKIAVNSYVTTKITFANFLTEVCEQIPGGDVDVVTAALGLDRRIGSAYLKGGLGFGGPCFPRDNVALAFLARSLAVDAPIAEATDRFNRSIPDRVVSLVTSQIQPGAAVAILGLAYKPKSHVVEESQTVLMARALLDAGYQVRAYDPLSGPMLKGELPPDLEIVESVPDTLSGTSAVIVGTSDEAYRNLGPSDFAGCAPGAVVIDCWRLLDAKAFRDGGVRYLMLGRGEASASSEERLWSMWQGH